MRRPSDRVWVLLALVLVLLIAAGLRLWQIGTIPPGFHFDESFEGLESWRILTEPGYKPVFLAGNFGVPPLNAYANALTFAIFGLLGGEAGPTAMRVTAAVFGLLGVLAVFALGDEMRRYDRRLTRAFPLLAAAALAVMRWHVHFSRMGIEPVIVPLEWAAASWLLLRGWRTGSRWSFAGCGAVLAASFYTYQAAWIIPALVAATAMLLWLRGGDGEAERETEERRENREKGESVDDLVHSGAPSPDPSPQPPHPTPHAPLRGLLLAAAVAALLVLPLAIFFLRNPDLLLLRPAQIAITGQEAAGSGFWHNALASVKMFVPLQGNGDMDPRRNLPGAPALSLWLAIPFWIGVGMALWRLGRPIYAMLVIGLAGLLLPGVVSEYAPHFHRILGAAAPVALLIALPLDWVLGRGKEERYEGNRRPLWQLAGIVIVVLVLGLGLMNTVRDYFGRWAALPDLYYAFDVGLWDVGQWVAARPEDEAIYLTPRAADHPTLAFAWRKRAKPPVTFDGRSIFPLTAAAGGAAEQYIAIEHEDFRTRLLLPGVFPDAQVTEQFLDRSGEVYTQVYTRPAGATPQLLPEITVDEPVGDGIRLLGYDLIPETHFPGDILYARLQWLVDEPPTGDWTVFTHLLDPSDPGRTVLAGGDGRPGGGSLPTDRWQAGWRIIDEFQIRLPSDLAPGDYALEVGLYQPSGARLPDGETGLILNEVHVVPSQ